MSRILIGSSNICRFYKPESFKKYNRYTTVRCTRFLPFKARIACIEAKEKEIVISVIENFICDEVGNDPENEDILNESIEKVIKEFVEVIDESAKKFPDTKFVLTCPIQRPRDKWYTENFDEMNKLYIESYNKLRKRNITTVNAISMSSQKFEEDKVHLTEESGSIFVDGILQAAEAFFGAELIDLEEEDKEGTEPMECTSESIPSGRKENGHINIPVKKTTDVSLYKAAGSIEDQDRRLEKNIQTLKATVLKRRESDN